jgi:hypothetical protein
MRRIVVVLLALAVTTGVASCGGSANGGSSNAEGGGPASAISTTPSDDLTGCLIDAGFVEPAGVVATVEVEGVQKVVALSFPPPHSEDDYLVVYEAPDDKSAAKAAAAFTGGPFIKQVGSLLYTVAGANDPLTPEQGEEITGCLRQ